MRSDQVRPTLAPAMCDQLMTAYRKYVPQVNQKHRFHLQTAAIWSQIYA
jgi:hypothetical protein